MITNIIKPYVINVYFQSKLILFLKKTEYKINNNNNPNVVNTNTKI